MWCCYRNPRYCTRYCNPRYHTRYRIPTTPYQCGVAPVTGVEVLSHLGVARSLLGAHRTLERLPVQVLHLDVDLHLLRLISN